jgi:two-component sensor histidine kinase
MTSRASTKADPGVVEERDLAGDAPMRVLIIDDNPDDRQLVRREVEALFTGAEVVELAGKAEFEAALAARVPDLVVTDLDLKWGSGREIFALARDAYPTCPVVMFTNSGDETIAVDLMKAGLDDYVVKSPRQLPRLRASLRIAVEGARNRAALTDRERRLSLALERQQTIVRELHHRVKNNLQTITSLLQIRARARGGALAVELDDLTGRMRALAAVQTRIYETDTLDQVDFAAALSDIAQGLTAVRDAGAVALLRDFDGPLQLEVNRAMPLGLLCYEIILNAVKHAWPAGRRGTLAAEIRGSSQAPVVRFRDDGIGFSKDEVLHGLGMRLTRALAKEANVEIETISRPGEGTTVTLRLV